MTAETFSDHLFTIYSISCIFIKYNYELNLKKLHQNKETFKIHNDELKLLQRCVKTSPKCYGHWRAYDVPHL